MKTIGQFETFLNAEILLPLETLLERVQLSVGEGRAWFSLLLVLAQIDRCQAGTGCTQVLVVVVVLI